MGGLTDKISVVELISNSSSDKDTGDGNCCGCCGLTCIMEFVVDTRKLIISKLTGCLENIFKASLSDMVESKRNLLKLQNKN